MSTILQDLRYGRRSFAKSPAFTAVALIVLAVGIGGNTAMFTLVNAMVLQPLPGHAPDIVQIFSHDRTRPDSYRSFSYPNYADIRDRNDVFDGVMAHTFAMVGIPAGDTMRRAFVQVVSANFFETLRVSLAAGRPFTADEERPGAQRAVTIVRYERWQAAGFDPAFIGSTIKINATETTIIGVAPRDFSGTMALVSPEMWLPLGMFDTVVNDTFSGKGTGLADRANTTLMLVGRFKRGVSGQTAAARLDILSRQLEEAYPAENRNQLLTTHPMARLSTSNEPRTDMGPVAAGLALMGVSASVLLIACLNLANMLLARGTSRRKEIAIRLALGGGRMRIVRQLVTESLLLALAGGGMGLLLAYWAMDLLLATVVDVLPMALTFKPEPDIRVLGVTVLFAVIATLVSSLGPALKVSRRDLVNDLKEIVADGAALGRRFSARNVLVVAQLGLSLALLAGGGLFVRSTTNAAATTPGFPYDGAIVATIDPSLARYSESQGRQTFAAVLERVRALPGVAAAGFASTVPFGEMHEGRPVERVGASAESPRQERSATFRIIGADYFRALGLNVVRGREFTRAEEELRNAPRVAMIDQRLAELLFPGEDPLGQMIRFVARGDERSADDVEPMQIVGIAPPIREDVVDPQPTPHIYLPWGRTYRSEMHVHVRSVNDSPAAVASLLATLRGELRAVDPDLPVLELSTMHRFHDRQLALWGIRAASRMLTAFGILALALAVIGVYGVRAYLVSHRTREIGIRMALGASSADVRSLVLREALGLTAAGLALGLPLAALLGMALRGMLLEVSSLDPLVFIGAPALLAAASMIASYVPARRAAQVAPLTALRSQ